MKRTVFLKSTLRQPVRTLFLLLLVGVISYAFSVRVGEYVLIDRETRELSGLYSAVGTLEALRDGEQTDGQQASDYLSQSPYIATLNTRRATSGVIQEDICNADIVTRRRMEFTADGGINDVYFYGTLINPYVDEAGNYYYEFQVDKVLAGYPENITEGGSMVVCGITDPETVASEGGWAPVTVRAGAGVFGPLRTGERYLVRATYNTAFGKNLFRGRQLMAKPFVEPNMVYFRSVDNSADDRVYYMKTAADTCFLPAPTDLDLTLPEYADLYAELQAVLDNQHALHLVGATDAGALVETQEASHLYALVQGRWPNQNDTDNQRAVCTVSEEFARLRGLELGDTITMKLRNIYSGYGYSGYDPMYQKAGVDYFEGSDATRDVTYTIVGTHSYLGNGDNTQAVNTTFVPLFTIPENFVATYPADGAVDSFVLNSVPDKEPFLLETKDALAELGYQVRFFDTNYDSFMSMSSAMKQTTGYNCVIFGVILAGTLVLAGFVYFRFRRRDLAISRALGVPAAACIRGSVVPLVLTGSIGILAGNLLAWRYIGTHSEEMLHSLLEISGLAEAQIVMLPYSILFALFGVLAAILLLTGLGFAIRAVYTPTLDLLQGGSGRKAGRPGIKAAPTSLSMSAPAPAARTVPVLSEHVKPAIPPVKRMTRAGLRPCFRFVRRSCLRAPVKSLLCLLLAGGFMVGLMLIRVSMIRSDAELDRLYSSITVTVEMNRDRAAELAPGMGFMEERLANRLLELDYLTPDYLEGAIPGSSIYYKVGGREYIYSERVYLRGIEDVDRFLSMNEITDFKVTYFEGWGEDMFSQTGAEAMTILLPRGAYEFLHIQPGDEVTLYFTDDTVPSTKFRVAGIYDSMECSYILIPFAGLQRVNNLSLPLARAIYTIDPARNRQMDSIRAEIKDLATEHPWTVSVTPVFYDRELRETVEPMEQVLAFMRVLYPVTVALSALVSAGVAVLLTMMSAKEAAILRVLGNSKSRCRAILCLQTLLVCIVGLIVGCIAAWLLAAGLAPDQAAVLMPPGVGRAGLYLLAALIGAAVSGTLMTAKNPLELLQVKE